MIDFFEPPKIDYSKIICHSGGALGSDKEWSRIGEFYGVKTVDYSYKTKYHDSPNKFEISDEDYKEGINEVRKANHWLNRYAINNYMNLLARNWAQVKYSNQTFAIGRILDIGEKGSKGYYSKSKYQCLDGGTAYCVMMSINHNRDVYVYDQYKEKWFHWSYNSMTFVESNIPKISVQNFAGVGTREINDKGTQAIRDVYQKTFNF